MRELKEYLCIEARTIEYKDSHGYRFTSAVKSAPEACMESVYLKSEADQVIAEKDTVIEEQAKEIKFMHQHCKYGEHCGTSCAQIHGELMQATIEIAELKAQKAQAEDDCAYWKMNEGNAVNAMHETEEYAMQLYNEGRHQKYKRCLDKAKWCDERCLRYELMQEIQGFSWKKEIAFYRRLHDKYMELAEKFKEVDK